MGSTRMTCDGCAPREPYVRRSRVCVCRRDRKSLRSRRCRKAGELTRQTLPAGSLKTDRGGGLSIGRDALTSLWVKYHFAHSHSPNRNKIVLKEEIDISGSPVCIASQNLGVRGGGLAGFSRHAKDGRAAMRPRVEAQLIECAICCKIARELLSAKPSKE
jgi:hypothetical protein